MFETRYAELLLTHYDSLFKEGLKRLWWIRKIETEKLSIEDIKVTKDTGLGTHSFTLERLQNEIRKNILRCPDDRTYTKYFHYLVKIQWTLKENSYRYSRSYDDWNNLKEEIYSDPEDCPSYDFGPSIAQYKSLDELIGHCNHLLHAPSFCGINFHVMLIEEFRYDINKWKEHIANKRGMPTYSEVENFLNKGIGKVEELKLNEDIKKEKDKLTHKQQIILLEKLGVFNSELVTNLSWEDKGKLFSYLLNRNEKNTTEYIRNLNIPKLKVSKDAYFVKSEENLEEVNKLLRELGLEKL